MSAFIASMLAFVAHTERAECTRGPGGEAWTCVYTEAPLFPVLMGVRERRFGSGDGLEARLADVKTSSWAVVFGPSDDREARRDGTRLPGHLFGHARARRDLARFEEFARGEGEPSVVFEQAALLRPSTSLVLCVALAGFGVVLLVPRRASA